MNKKTWALIATAIILGVVYLIHFSGLFKPKVMQISHNGRFGRINFSLGNAYDITSIKVVPVLALQSNKYALPIWELKSGSNSIPTKLFAYGERIRGMKPIVSNDRPEALQLGVPYRIFVEAGALKAEHDFTP